MAVPDDVVGPRISFRRRDFHSTWSRLVYTLFHYFPARWISFDAFGRDARLAVCTSTCWSSRGGPGLGMARSNRAVILVGIEDHLAVDVRAGAADGRISEVFSTLRQKTFLVGVPRSPPAPHSECREPSRKRLMSDQARRTREPQIPMISNALDGVVS